MKAQMKRTKTYQNPLNVDQRTSLNQKNGRRLKVIPENMECHERDSWKVRQKVFHFSKTEISVNKTSIFDVTKIADKFNSFLRTLELIWKINPFDSYITKNNTRMKPPSLSVNELKDSLNGFNELKDSFTFFSLK